MSLRNILRPGLLILALALAGCGGEEKKAATQVAAKVNSGEISVHQINNVLSRARAGTPEQMKAAGKAVLERLIDQELMVQKALDAKLDRNPAVLQALEAARRDVLAKAYVEQVTSSVARPSEQEIKDYYQAHPELFAERRIFSLREVAIAAPQDFTSTLQAKLGEVKTINELGDWLKSQGIRFAVNASTQPAEKLPLEWVGRLHKLQDGQAAVISSPKGVLLLEVLGSRTEPIAEDKAGPVIEQFLVNQKKSELAKAELAKLRSSAKLEYMGDFAGGGSASDEAATAEAQVPEPAADTGANIEKGLSGLK